MHVSILLEQTCKLRPAGRRRKKTRSEMKHNNSISVRAGLEDRGAREGGEQDRRREDGGFSSVTTQGGGVQGSRRGQRLNSRMRRGVARRGEEEECWSSLHSEWMSPVYTLNSVHRSQHVLRTETVAQHLGSLSLQKHHIFSLWPTGINVDSSGPGFKMSASWYTCEDEWEFILTVWRHLILSIFHWSYFQLKILQWGLSPPKKVH